MQIRRLSRRVPEPQRCAQNRRCSRTAPASGQQTRRHEHRASDRAALMLQLPDRGLGLLGSYGGTKGQGRALTARRTAPTGGLQHQNSTPHKPSLSRTFLPTSADATAMCEQGGGRLKWAARAPRWARRCRVTAPRHRAHPMCLMPPL